MDLKDDSFSDYELAMDIAHEFVEHYKLADYHDPLIIYFGVQSLGIADPSVSPDKEHDLCIFVGSFEPLPARLNLPSTFKGFRVFYRVIGKPKPLQS